ncbi:MAG: fold metallo-hydrolase [Marmoricola sp.]|nr:fold metallo-hydrolase [Marmoricola sp.]
MLEPVVEGVLVRQSTFCQSNAVAVQGQAGVLVVDAGVLEAELVELAQELHDRDQVVVAGFSTHPHWDHLLWHARLGDVPRYGTARCATAIQTRLSAPQWQDFVAGMIPADIVEQVPLDLFGTVTGLPVGAEHVPWDGPAVRVLEHGAHAPGHAALLIEEPGVLVAGDMLSDVLVPVLDQNAVDPVADYLEALLLLEGIAGSVEFVVPGHGSVGRGEQVRARIEQDRAYVCALRDGTDPDDPRLGPHATYGWVADLHERQRQALASRPR